MKPLFSKVAHDHFALTRRIFSRLDLGRGQPPVLRVLRERDGITQRELADEINVAPATVTVMLQTMEKNGLIERRDDENDKRIVRVYITKRGRESDDAAKSEMERINAAVRACFTDEEFEMFEDFLTRMDNKLVELKEEQPK